MQKPDSWQRNLQGADAASDTTPDAGVSLPWAAAAGQTLHQASWCRAVGCTVHSRAELPASEGGQRAKVHEGVATTPISAAEKVSLGFRLFPPKAQTPWPRPLRGYAL